MRIPAKPIRIDNQDSKDLYTYRYNLSGEPLKDAFMTDAEAIKTGYVSVSVLDYSLSSSSFIKDISKMLDE